MFKKTTFTSICKWVAQSADTRTLEQKMAMLHLLEVLHRRYPKALILGHHDLNPQKACPCIPDVAREYAKLNEVRACSRSTK